MHHAQQTVIYGHSPLSFTTAFWQRCDEIKWPPSLLQFEDFGREAGVESCEPIQAEICGCTYVQGLEVPADLTLLQGLRQAGFEISLSCEAGSCAVCEVGYVDGKVIHKGVALGEEEKQHSILNCVSKANGKVVLAF